MDKGMMTAENIISQDILRQVEALCTQTQPPACTAACPLHMDAREFCRLVAANDMPGAFKMYQKAVPFARLVACTCDAPCESRCKRGQLGGSLRMQMLEQFVCTSHGKPDKAPLLLSKKSQRAAIIGGGLRGMSAAAQLARKGYGVTLFEQSHALGGWLCTQPEDVVPPVLLQEELRLLTTLRVQVEYGIEVPLENPQTVRQALPEDFNAVFVACASPLDELSDGDSLLVEGESTMLAGRRSGRMTTGHSTVYDVYDGRSAATSIERLFLGANLMNGREKEGSRETKLFTNLQGIASVQPAEVGKDEFTAEQAVAEAERCIQCQCLECVKKCGFMQTYGGDPSRYVREVYNNLSIAMGNHHANKMINTCALCSQCESVCPFGLDMRQVFLAARERMVKSIKMPPSAHEFALEDMDYSLSDAFYLLRHQPGHTTSAYLFFPGCQLAASEPGLVKTAYNDLISRIDGGCGLWLGCCGVMANWAGSESLFSAVKKKLVADWEHMGRPTVIAGCPTCQSTLSGEFGIETVGLLELLEQEGLPADNCLASQNEMVLHHACGARHRPELQQSARNLCVASGITLQNEAVEGNQSPCCGYGGLVPFVSEDVAGKITNTALNQLAPNENTPVLTYCVNCRDRYLAQGRSSWHLLELLYPDGPKAYHTPPTWSKRQQNRNLLQAELLKELWGEQKEARVVTSLYIEPELEQKIQDKHILHSDIAAAIEWGEAEECVLLDAKTGHRIINHRPRNVTFWVEYTPEETGYRIHNAWCHRMHAIVTDKLTESGAQDHE